MASRGVRVRGILLPAGPARAGKTWSRSQAQPPAPLGHVFSRRAEPAAREPPRARRGCVACSRVAASGGAASLSALRSRAPAARDVIGRRRVRVTWPPSYDWFPLGCNESCVRAGHEKMRGAFLAGLAGRTDGRGRGFGRLRPAGRLGHLEFLPPLLLSSS
jgi:hypothetical protein